MCWSSIHLLGLANKSLECNPYDPTWFKNQCGYIRKLAFALSENLIKRIFTPFHTRPQMDNIDKVPLSNLRAFHMSEDPLVQLRYFSAASVCKSTLWLWATPAQRYGARVTLGFLVMFDTLSPKFIDRSTNPHSQAVTNISVIRDIVDSTQLCNWTPDRRQFSSNGSQRDGNARGINFPASDIPQQLLDACL